MTEPPSSEHVLAPLAAPASTMSARLAAAAEVVLCSGIPTQWIIGTLIATALPQPAPAPAAPTLLFVSVLLLADTCVLAGLMVGFMRRRGESPSAVWLGSRPWGREARLGVALVPVIFLAVVVLLNVLRLLAPWLHNVPANPLEEIASGTATDAAIFAVVAIVAGGVREELQRAFLLRRFERYLGGPTVGVIVLSVAFGLGHYIQGWDAAVTTAALGAFWAVLYLRRGSCIGPLASHAGFNALEIVRVALLGG